MRGHRMDSELLYVISEKHLYVKKDIRNARRIFICYQTILSARKSIMAEHHPKCTARVSIDGNGICTKNPLPHTQHKNHEQIYFDLATSNAVKDGCIFIKEKFPEQSHKISEKAIFFRELAK